MRISPAFHIGKNRKHIRENKKAAIFISKKTIGIGRIFYSGFFRAKAGRGQTVRLKRGAFPEESARFRYRRGAAHVKDEIFMKTKRYRLSAGMMIALGFLSVIAAGTLLLLLPFSHNGKLSFIDALFTSTSAVCVTGLVTVEIGTTYTLFGQIVTAVLIQIGGLGITSLGAGLIALLGGRLNQRENNLVREALNRPSFKDIFPLIKAVLCLTLVWEAAGAALSFPVFIRDYSAPRAVWLSIYHSIAAFNNAGFDILGRGDSICYYAGDIYFNVVTAILILGGGFGFFAMYEIMHRKKGERFSLHVKTVSFMTVLLTAGGGILLKLSERDGLTWTEAFFSAVTARTAGFASIPMSTLSAGGVVLMCILMFIGASPGSTGGGVKTTTVFVLAKSLASAAKGREPVAFGKRLKDDIVHKASLIVFLGIALVLAATFTLSLFEPQSSLADLIFEEVSAVATTGLSRGITAALSVPSKIVLIISMYLGRLGPLSIATLWAASKKSGVSRPEEDIPIG